ncbi:transglycosylase domain-containing protein [Haloimpatiens sp. FM7330]|uniref:transglycosylase domain-containing protein n=1 Tax=Haloimpatiens sp. FM7330 TaxID=3298610 RepID=UPI00362724A9
MTKRKKTGKKKSGKKKIFKTLVLTILMIFILASVALGGIILAMVKASPELNVNQILTFNETSKLYDDNNKLMDSVLTHQKRTYASFEKIPNNLKNAFVSIEDERFFTHKGIDIKRIAGAFFIDIKNKLTHKRNLQGASTITQQLIKNSVLTNEVTIKRKVQEIFLATQLEKKLNKNQILEAYLNTIYLGRGAYGVGAAAEQYFSKSIEQLNLVECAYLAGVTQSPSVYDAFSPTSQKNPSIYLKRTKTVLNKMHENGHITNEEYSQAIDDVNNGNLKFKPSKIANKMQYEWFSREVIKQVKKDLKNQYGYDDNQVNNLIMHGGLKIYTTMNKDLQTSTQNILNNMSNSLGIKEFKKDGIPELQASSVIMDYRTGEVKAMVGGRGDQPALSLNRATDALNPPGSSMKPLAVYSPAIDTKMATASTVFNDDPLPKEFREKYNGYNPRNSPPGYKGPLTLRLGLGHSKNTIAVQVEDFIGLKTGSSYAEKFGLSLTESDKNSIAALSLGEIHGTNPLTMAAAYGTFGNKGMRTEPRLYRKVEDRNGNAILESKLKSHRVISPETAYIMYDMLKEPLIYIAPKGRFSSMARGKTGTTTDSKDLWFSGLTPYYSCAVWIGEDKNGDFNGRRKYGRYVGSNDASGIWGKIMKEAHKNLPVKTIPRPSGVETASVCKVSGKIPNPFCNESNNVYKEFFIRGTIPTEFCDVHKQQEIIKDDTENEDENNDENSTDNDVNTDENNNNNTDNSSNSNNDNTNNNTDNNNNDNNNDNSNNDNNNNNNNTDNNTGDNSSNTETPENNTN